MSVFNDLLFLHGYIGNVELAQRLAGPDSPKGDAGPPSQANPAEPSTTSASPAHGQARQQGSTRPASLP